jgi:hypothetical protein
VTLKRLFGYPNHGCQPLLDRVDHPDGHFRSGVPVVGAHGASFGALLALPVAATLQAFSATYIRRHEVVDEAGPAPA